MSNSKDVTLETYRGIAIKADTTERRRLFSFDYENTIFAVRVHVDCRKIAEINQPGLIARLVFGSTTDRRIRKAIKKARRFIDQEIEKTAQKGSAQTKITDLLEGIALEDKNGLLKAQSMAREPNGRNDRNR